MAVLVDRCRLLSALLFAVCLLLPLAADAKPVEYCDKNADYAVKVKGVEISPDPVKRGRTAKFDIAASTGDAIPTGNLVIDVQYFGLQVYQETHDLCKETSCPVLTGDFVLSHSEKLPIFTPPGTYTLVMTMMGEDGKQLTCINFDFSIGFWLPFADI